MTGDARIVGPEIEDPDEELRRVVSDLKSKGGVPARGAFVPTKSAFKPSSDGGLSTKREAQHPAAVFAEYLSLGKTAVGVWGVHVGTFSQVGADLGCRVPTHDDGGMSPSDGGAPYPEHHATVWYPIGSRSGFTERSRLRAVDIPGVGGGFAGVAPPGAARTGRRPRMSPAWTGRRPEPARAAHGTSTSE